MGFTFLLWSSDTRISERNILTHCTPAEYYLFTTARRITDKQLGNMWLIFNQYCGLPHKSDRRISVGSSHELGKLCGSIKAPVLI